MRAKGRKGAMYLAAGMLLMINLGCNLPTPPATTPVKASITPEVLTVVATATSAGPTQSPGEETVEPTGTSNSSGGEPTVPVDNEIVASVSIKGEHTSYEGKISFPGNDSSDEIFIKPVGFDSTVTSGTLVFTLTCSGEKMAKVNYKGSAIQSGSPGCGETWKVAVVNGSPDSHIIIRLDDSGEVDWVLSVTGGP